VKHIIGCCSIVNFLLFLLHPVSRTAAPNLQGRPSPSNVYAHDDEVLGELGTLVPGRRHSVSRESSDFYISCESYVPIVKP